MLRATLIYNPRAGPVSSATTIESVASFWRDLGWHVSIEATRAAGHAQELARNAAAAGHSLVLAAGGDGTLGDVANGLAGSDTIMAPIPTGTANSFARELRMPMPHVVEKHRVFKTAESLAAGKVKSMDLGYVTGPGIRDRFWLLWAGAGADGYAVRKLEPRPWWSRRLGRLGYVTQVVGTALRLPRMRARVDVDGQSFEGEFLLILISNCRRYAGGELLLSPDAHLDDGLLEVWLFRGHGFAHVFKYFIEARLGRHLADPNAIFIRGRRISIHAQSTLYCQTDGEPAGLSPLECEIRPRALRLLVPVTAPEDLFEQEGETLDQIAYQGRHHESN